MQNEVKILRLSHTDLSLFKELIGLLNRVFEEYNSTASDQQLNNLLVDSKFYAVVAIIDGKIVGGLTAYELQKYYRDNSELYLYDIAVKIELQHQGIGKKLVYYLKDCGLKNNIETIFVEAHSDDIEAVKFYEAIIGTSEKVDHFNLEIKK